MLCARFNRGESISIQEITISPLILLLWGANNSKLPNTPLNLTKSQISLNLIVMVSRDQYSEIRSNSSNTPQ